MSISGHIHGRGWGLFMGVQEYGASNIFSYITYCSDILWHWEIYYIFKKNLKQRGICAVENIYSQALFIDRVCGYKLIQHPTEGWPQQTFQIFGKLHVKMFNILIYFNKKMPFSQKCPPWSRLVDDLIFLS